MFNAILIEDQPHYRASVTSLNRQQLPKNDVQVQVDYSSLNYKDALAITGKAPVVRQFPLVPGIDFAGTVTHSDSDSFQSGDKVLLNGWGVGEKYWGGLAQHATAPASMLQRLPAGISTKQAMILGTAGYTAMLCIQSLQRHGITPAHGSILVTGANGGVGSVAILLLARLGYQVTASTGRPEEAEQLKKLGASDIIDRAELSSAGKPLAKERWAGAVDSVGSHTLASVCASTKYGGAVAACGLAQGMDFPASVAPFILRGITLYGIDSVMQPMPARVAAWQQLATLLTPADYQLIGHEMALSEIIPAATLLLEGKIRGRIVVDVNR
jgi:acrylyl-CoA reductase (NADPH)